MNVDYWTVQSRDSLNGRMGDQKMKIGTVLARSAEVGNQASARGDSESEPGPRYPGYDIVVVRGPPAYAKEDHGRMQSIATSSFAAAPSGSHVFVLNCGRDIERRWSEHYLAKPVPSGDSGYSFFPPDSPLLLSTALPSSSHAKLLEALATAAETGQGVIGDTTALLPLWTAGGVKHVLGDMATDPVVGDGAVRPFRLVERSGIYCHFART